MSMRTYSSESLDDYLRVFDRVIMWLHCSQHIEFIEPVNGKPEMYDVVIRSRL